MEGLLFFAIVIVAIVIACEPTEPFQFPDDEDDE